MHQLSPSGFADSWNDHAQYKDVINGLVLGGVFDDYG